MDTERTTEQDALTPTFDRIGGSECPTCLRFGHRCHPDGGLIACVEVCDRCEKALEARAKSLRALRTPPGSGSTEEGERRG